MVGKFSLTNDRSLKDGGETEAEEECALRLLLPHEQVRRRRRGRGGGMDYLFFVVTYSFFSPLHFFQTVVLVFDNLQVREQFQESLSKSLAYCDSRRARALEAGSLDFKTKEQFSAVGQKKFKGTTYAQSFFGTDFVDWVEKTEGCDRERAVQVRGEEGKGREFLLFVHLI